MTAATRHPQAFASIPIARILAMRQAMLANGDGFNSTVTEWNSSSQILYPPGEDRLPYR